MVSKGGYLQAYLLELILCLLDLTNVSPALESSSISEKSTLCLAMSLFRKGHKLVTLTFMYLPKQQEHRKEGQSSESGVEFPPGSWGHSEGLQGAAVA